jgi:CO/xanthine dehydrogenase Mo-binding subunit
MSAAASVYPEELAVPAAALLLGRPIKWVEDRREGFTATNHEREQDWDLEAAIDADGRLLAVRGKVHHDHGSATPSGLSTAQNSASNFIGPYVLPAVHIDFAVCLTNFAPATSSRGAGRSVGVRGDRLGWAAACRRLEQTCLAEPADPFAVGRKQRIECLPARQGDGLLLVQPAQPEPAERRVRDA